MKLFLVIIYPKCLYQKPKPWWQAAFYRNHHDVVNKNMLYVSYKKILLHKIIFLVSHILICHLLTKIIYKNIPWNTCCNVPLIFFLAFVCSQGQIKVFCLGITNWPHVQKWMCKTRFYKLPAAKFRQNNAEFFSVFKKD